MNLLSATNSSLFKDVDIPDYTAPFTLVEQETGVEIHDT